MRLRPLASDTSPDAEAILLEHYRRLTVHERVRIALDLSQLVDRIALEGIRERHPGASERQVRLRLAALKYGREGVLAAFGWDPQEQGW